MRPTRVSSIAVMASIGLASAETTESEIASVRTNAVSPIAPNAIPVVRVGRGRSGVRWPTLTHLST